MTQSNTKQSNDNSRRTSVSGSKASMTIEAALTIPVFFFAVLSLVYLMEVQAIRTTIHAAALNAAKICTEDTAVVSILNPIKLESEMVKFIGSEKMNRSIISGGSSGLHCGTSYLSPLSGELKIIVKYNIKMPFPGFMNLTAKCKEELKLSSWNGFIKRGMESEDNQIVYITETGWVYHEDYNCTYLQLSIQFVPYEDLWKIRNEEGGKYYKCEKCVHGDAMPGVYITNSGNKYHNSLSCSGLKRTIYAIPKSEAFGRGGCSRCTK